MIGFPIGLLAANAAEWAVHKYLLHGLGKRKGSFWSFHWHEHHAESRRSACIDPCYERPLFRWHSQGKEAALLLGACVVITPLLPVAPFFVAAGYYSAARYYRLHRRAHEEPGWARAHLPWHYDHHMGPQQDANWCVSRPWWDHIVGTRRPYAGTDAERRDLERRAARSRRVVRFAPPALRGEGLHTRPTPDAAA